jgi:hypothetical protein
MHFYVFLHFQKTGVYRKVYIAAEHIFEKYAV